MKLSKAILVNPKRDLKKGKSAPFISMQDIEPNRRFVKPKTRRIVTGSGSKFKNGDTLLARITPSLENGKTVFVESLDPDEVGFGSTEFIVLSGKPETTDDLFVYYVARSPDFRYAAIQSMTGTSGRQRVQETVFDDFEIKIPDLNIQRRITCILGTIDNKINNLITHNQVLDKIIQSIFKSWFIDFDGQTEFVDSELGEIPKGWKIKPLECVLSEIEVGSRPKGGVSDIKIGIPSIGAESIVRIGVFDYSKTKYVSYEFFKEMKRGHVKSRDVLLYKDGGKPGNFEPHVTLVGDGFPFDVCTINEHVYRIRTNEQITQTFLYFWLSSQTVMDEMRVKGTGAAIPGLNSTQVRSLHMLIPVKEIMDAFETRTEPLLAKILSNSKEIRILSILRDVLLPKLMSAEIRV